MTSLLRILRFAPQLNRLYLGIAVSSVLAAVLTLATPFLIGAATDRIVAAIAGETTVEDAVVAVGRRSRWSSCWWRSASWRWWP